MGLSCHSKTKTSHENLSLKADQISSKIRPNSTNMNSKQPLAARSSHTNSRSTLYNNEVERFPVPDDKVSWETNFPDYKPIEFTTDRVKNNRRADPIDPTRITKFNQLDGGIDRRSFLGIYHVDPQTNRPRNPIGRTGITGRGRLYYWGPNHAGDPVVTRWARDERGLIVYCRTHINGPSKPVLEFVAIQRRDTGFWALPGGMVDPGEDVSQTIKREFQEEAMRDGVDPKKIEELFSHGERVYQWYADDPRNTDNAWIETVAMHFHDSTGNLTKNLHLNAGDDAEKVVWRRIDKNLQVYGSHKEILRLVAERVFAYW